MRIHWSLYQRGKMKQKTFATKGEGIAKQRTLQVKCKRIPYFVSRRHRGVRKQTRNTNRELKRKIKAMIERLRAEIGEEQQCIKDGQRQVRNKYEQIAAEREQLKREVEVISKQNASIQLRLNLMFRIVKARGQNDSVLVDQLTQSLRDLLAKENKHLQ